MGGSSEEHAAEEATGRRQRTTNFDGEDPLSVNLPWAAEVCMTKAKRRVFVRLGSAMDCVLAERPSTLVLMMINSCSYVY